MREAARARNDVYLRLSHPAVLGNDGQGNYLFEVEASNENLDLQKQIVLQRALLNSKKHFLTNGVISLDHLHKREDGEGGQITDLRMVIGEPLEVRIEGKRTIVKGKLYGNNDHAMEIIQLLKAGSTRVKASVGGIMPKIVRDARTGIEKVTSVLWNDLALTVSPVNSTVGEARIVRKGIGALCGGGRAPLCGARALAKALIAGGGAGALLLRENLSIEPIEVGLCAGQRLPPGYDEALAREVAQAIRDGRIGSEADAARFLLGFGLDGEVAREMARNIYEREGGTGMGCFSKSRGVKKASGLKKSLKKGAPIEGEDEGPEVSVSYDGDDDDEEEDDGLAKSEDGEEDEEDEEGEGGQEGEEVEDADDVIKSMQKRLAMVERQLGRPVPAKSAFMSKSATGKRTVVPKADIYDLPIAQRVLVKAVRAKEIDVLTAEKISSDLQKAIASGKAPRRDYYAFIRKRCVGEL